MATITKMQNQLPKHVLVQTSVSTDFLFRLYMLSTFAKFSFAGKILNCSSVRKLSSISQSNLCLNASRKTGTVSLMVTSFPSSWDNDVTSFPSSPHGTMCLNQDKSALQFKETPCVVTNRLPWMPVKKTMVYQIQDLET